MLGGKVFGAVGTCWGSYMVLRQSSYPEVTFRQQNTSYYKHFLLSLKPEQVGIRVTLCWRVKSLTYYIITMDVYWKKFMRQSNGTRKATSPFFLTFLPDWDSMYRGSLLTLGVVTVVYQLVLRYNPGRWSFILKLVPFFPFLLPTRYGMKGIFCW